MSDGPHRDLPMQRHWRALSERAANSACPLDQVCEALLPALKREFAEVPLEPIRDILGGGEQGSLFQNRKELVEQLEMARYACRGLVAGNTLIDCVIEAIDNGQTGKIALETALENSLRSLTHSYFRSIEEHYLRKTTVRGAHFIRDRLKAVRGVCAFKAVATDLFTGEKEQSKSLRLRKRSDVDEGPLL